MAISERCGACGSTIRAHRRGKHRNDNAKTDRHGYPRPAAGRRPRRSVAALRRLVTNEDEETA